MTSKNFIGNITARVITYIIPLAATLTFSVIVLIAIVIKLYRHKQSVRQVIGTNTVNIAPLVLKLFFLLGAIEVVGFIQFPDPQSSNQYHINAIFKVLFSFVRSFRGVFIFILFVARNIVIKSLREKFNMCMVNQNTGSISHDQESRL